MKRAITIGACFLGLPAAIVMWMVFEPWFNTKYSKGFEEDSFKLIQTNASIDAVYALVGPPLLIRVNRPDPGGGEDSKTDYNVALDYVKSIAMQSNTAAVYMEFSAPRTAFGYAHYFRFMVKTERGLVRWCIGPVRMD